MASLDGYITQAPWAGLANPRLSIGLNAFHLDIWPPHESIIASPTGGEIETAWPVEAHGRGLDGWVATAVEDDWYHRIHIVPRRLPVGNVVSTQIEEVYVWNAYFHPVSLISIDGVESGLELNGLEPPAEFGAIQVSRWELSISSEGQPTIDVVLTWNFADVPDVTLRVTGSRIIAFAFVPNWARGVRETLAWWTDRLRSSSAAEQRRALRRTPRRMFEARFLLEGREWPHFDLMMHEWGGRLWAMPVWPDVQRLTTSVQSGALQIDCDTRWRDFRAGALALLRADDSFTYETVQVASMTDTSIELLRPVQASWPAGTRLYPVRTAQMAEQPRVRRITDRAYEATIQFAIREPNDWPAIAPTTNYRGHPVYEERPDESSELEGTYDRILYVLDNGTGIPFSVDSADAGFPIQQHSRVLTGRQEKASFRSLLYALRGAQVSMWIPTHAEDMQFVTPVDASDLSITIANIAYERFGFNQPGRQDIRVELKDGTALHRRIVGAQAIDAHTEQITIDAPFGRVIPPEDVQRVSFMMLATLEHDDVDIVHLTDGEGVARSELRWVRVRDDV